MLRHANIVHSEAVGFSGELEPFSISRFIALPEVGARLEADRDPIRGKVGLLGWSLLDMTATPCD
jgi:hypothetical protein